jgi:hypothetical protein
MSVDTTQEEVKRLHHELATLKAAASEGEEISIGNYLLTRLTQLGVTVSRNDLPLYTP